MENINAFYSPLLQAEGQVKIYEGEFNLKTEEKNYLINGKLYMTFDPIFDIKLKGTTKERNNFIKEENLLLFIPGMLPTRVEVTSSKNGTYFVGNIDQICNSENARMDSYILYTINYMDFIGSVVKSNEKLYRGGLPLEIEGWSIEIQKRHDYKEKDIFRELKNSHGYNITHIIEIKRADGEDFNKNDLVFTTTGIILVSNNSLKAETSYREISWIDGSCSSLKIKDKYNNKNVNLPKMYELIQNLAECMESEEINVKSKLLDMKNFFV